MDELIDKALRNIYESNYTGEFEQNLWHITASQLNKAVDEAFKEFDSGSPEQAFANKLKYQNAILSAFKSKQQTTTLNNIRIATQAKSFTEFKKSVLSVVQDYNKRYLKIEYATAKQSARSAKNYQNALKDEDLYPNIKYMPSIAVEPREEHKKYYNVIKPLEDPFWNTHLPPLTWGCQCQWKTTDEEVSELPADLPKPDPGLDINPGKEGALFSQSHPYFDQPDAVSARVIKSNIAAMHKRPISDLTYFYGDKKTKGSAYSFDWLGKEHALNTRIGKAYALKGHDVQLFGYKHPDSKINGIWNEFKSPAKISIQSIDQNFRKANNQFKNRKITGDVTFDLKGEVNKKYLIEAIRKRIRRPGYDNRINQVHFVKNNIYMGYSTIEDIIDGKLPF
jgi:hypothetical protein